MTIFFFVVGLEIRREIHDGELRELRRAALPLAAARRDARAGAASTSRSTAGAAGAAGLGRADGDRHRVRRRRARAARQRVPPALRVLLLALAVIDDIGAILVIAIFYSSGVSLGGLGGRGRRGCAA